MQVADFDYELPEALIAQQPLPERTASRMLVLDRAGDRLIHTGVRELGRFLNAGDLLILNNTRVVPARIWGERTDTGGEVEVLLLDPLPSPGDWTAMYKASHRPRAGLAVALAGGRIHATVLSDHGGGRVDLRLVSEDPLMQVLQEEGVAPLPPYIRREHGGDSGQIASDKSRYQTVYAAEPGAIAAPTAGLHLSEALLSELAGAGIDHAFVTLHVGPGTFLPVKAEQVHEHVMEAERYVVPEATAAAVRAVRQRGGRVVAVGSTSVRTLESVAGEDGTLTPGAGRSALYIYPPYRFRVVDAMLTNFHLPRSTLLMMIAALAGRERVLAAYREAVAQRYRFYSYGDCMLIV